MGENASESAHVSGCEFSVACRQTDEARFHEELHAIIEF
jgi:hypothetical protein